MQLGVNNEVNLDAKKVGVAHMEGGPSKIKRQISREQSGPVSSSPQKPALSSPQKPVLATSTAHENNKIWFILGLLLVAFAFSHVIL